MQNYCVFFTLPICLKVFYYVRNTKLWKVNGDVFLIAVHNFQALIEKEQLKEELIDMRQRMSEHVEHVTARLQQERDKARAESNTERDQLNKQVIIILNLIGLVSIIQNWI